MYQLGKVILTYNYEFIGSGCPLEWLNEVDGYTFIKSTVGGLLQLPMSDSGLTSTINYMALTPFFNILLHLWSLDWNNPLVCHHDGRP